MKLCLHKNFLCLRKIVCKNDAYLINWYINLANKSSFNAFNHVERKYFYLLPT